MLGGDSLVESHLAALPDLDAVPHADGLLDMVGDVSAHQLAVHVPQHVAALHLDGEAREECRVGRHLLPVGVGVAGDVPVAVHRASLDVDAQVGEVGQHEVVVEARAGGVADEHRLVVLSRRDDVETLLEARAGALDAACAGKEFNLERGAGGDVVAHEDEEDLPVVDADAGGARQIAVYAVGHGARPVVRVAVGFVGAEAELLLPLAGPLVGGEAYGIVDEGCGELAGHGGTERALVHAGIGGSELLGAVVGEELPDVSRVRVGIVDEVLRLLEFPLRQGHELLVDAHRHHLPGTAVVLRVAVARAGAPCHQQAGAALVVPVFVAVVDVDVEILADGGVLGDEDAGSALARVELA